MKFEVLSGVTIAIIGVLILLSGSMHGYYMPPEMGILFICAGFLWIIYSVLFRKRLDSEMKKSKEKEEDCVICLNCRKPFFKDKTNNYSCPDCGGIPPH